MQAINHVMTLSKMADATAAEVADSVRLYDDALRSLSGYRIVLDLLAADHFGVAGAKSLVTLGKELDFSDREHFIDSLEGLKEKKLVAEVEALSQRPDRRFFHWEIEFPEIFFGFTGIAGQRIQHRERIESGSAGFDAIVGNPPYVQQQTLKPLKKYLKQVFQTYDSVNDLYVFFQEIEVRHLRAQGRMGMIVANKWMRSGYGESIRGFLKRVSQPLEVIDFGHSPIFPDADTFPCILLVNKRSSAISKKDGTPDNEEMVACEIPRDKWNANMDLIAYVNTSHHLIPTSYLRDKGWSLEITVVQDLLEKIRETGVPLREYAKAKPLRGLLTGLNEAFVIDSTTRDRLIREHKTSGDVIKPLLRGRDVARWKNRDSGSYLITIASSENVDWPWSEAGTEAEKIFGKTYPAIYQHFLPFRAALVKRQDQGRFYWELRSCDYMNEFGKRKIIWQEMAWFTRFSLDLDGFVVLNTAYLIPSTNPEILAFLNSPLAWWYMWRTAQHGKDEVLRLIRDYTEEFPIPTTQTHILDQITSNVAKMIRHSEDYFAFELQVGESFQSLLGTGVDPVQISASLALESEKFVARTIKQHDAGRLSPAGKDQLRVLHERLRKQQVQLLTNQLDIERKLATLVEDAYGLTQEERALLRSSRPVRDPLDVLEAKIRGEMIVEEATEDE